MSRTIDEKVVEMRFDNSDFERNVSQSMSTLDKLKGALDFSGASKAFDGITSAANKVDLGGLTGAFDGVHEKVTNLEKVINGFFENVGRRLSNFAIDQVKGVTLEPVMEGFGKYEQKSKAVQTIMNATGQSIEDVSKQLEKLNWYTDETSYDFAEMVTTVGKFTSAGVDLERAVTAMQGIANWAAVSGAEKQQANMAMYNLAQALGMGFVGAADYRSIMNANMDTREFKQMVIDEAIKEGTLAVQTLEDGTEVLVAMNKETKELIYENEKEGKLLEVNADNFYSTLTKGKWFDRDVLLNVTDKYGRFSDLLNQFYNDVVDNGFDVTTSELIAYVDAYRDGTLDMNDAIKETGLSAEYLTDVLTQLSSEEFELSEKAFKAGNEARTFKDAIDATKDAVSTAWMNTFELLFGNYEEARVLWTALSNELWDIFAGPINSINDILSEWRKIELDDGTILDGRDDFINGIKDIYHALRSVVDPITEAWEAIFPSIDQFQLYDITKAFADFTNSLVLSDDWMKRLETSFEKIFGVIKLVTDGVGGLIDAFTSGLFSGGDSGFFRGIGEAIEFIGNSAEKLTNTIGAVRSAIEYHKSGDDWLGILDVYREVHPVLTGILETYDKMKDSLGIVGELLRKQSDLTVFIKDGTISFESIIDGLTSKFSFILRAVGDLVHIWTGSDISKTIDNIRAILFDLFDGIKAFLGSERWSDVKYAISGIANAFKDTFGPAWQAAVAIFDDWIAGIRTLISGADGDFNGFFDTIMKGAYWVADFVRSWKGGVEFISEFLTKFLSLTDAIEVYRANGGGILGVLAVINDKLRIIIDTVADLIQNVTGFDVHGIGDSILDVIQGIGYAVLQVADTISKAFGWTDNPFGKLLGQIGDDYVGFDTVGINFTGVFEKIGEAFSKIGELFQAVAPGISSALSGVKVVLQDVIQLFKDLGSNMSLPDMLHLIMQIVSVFSGIRLAKKAGKMFEAIGDALNSWQKTLKVQMLLAIAGSIAMIAGAAYLISKIDNEKIGLVIGTLATAFGGLIGVLYVSKHGNADNLKALPGIILSVAVAMGVLSLATDKLADVMTKFGQISNFWEAFTNFSATLLVISGIIAILAKLNAQLTAKDGLTNTNAINGIVTSIGKLAVSMLLLAGVIKLYEAMDFWKIAEGLGKIIVALAGAGIAMGAAEFLFNLISRLKGGFTSMESTATSMLKFSGALAILIAVIGALTLIKWGNLLSSLGKAIVAIAGFSAGLIIFSGALAVVNKLKVLDVLDKVADAMWKFAKTVAVLVGISVIIGLISEVFGDSLTDLVDKGLEFIEYAIHSLSERSATIAHDLAVIIVDIIREALRVLAENIPEITQYLVEILGGLIQGVKDAMAHGDLNIWEVLGGAGLFAGILGLVVFLKKNRVGASDFGAAALAIGGAALLILEMGVLFAAMGYLGDAIGGVEGLKKMQEFASGIVHVFTDDWGVLALFGVLMAVELLASKFGVAFGHASGIFEGFKSAGMLVASVVGLLDELGVLFAATGIVLGTWGVPFIQKAGELYKAIADIFAENNGGVTLLFIAIAGILAVFSKFKLDAPNAGAVGDVVVFLAEAVGIIDALGALFAATGLLIEAIEMIPNVKDGAVVIWVEKAGDLFEAIGAAIGKLVGGLVGGIANGAIKEATKGVTTDMVDLIKGMGECLKVMSEAGLIAAAATWAGGPIGLEVMAAEMASMAPHFVKFAEGVSSLSHDTAEKAKICAEALQALIALVPETGGIKQWWNGEINIPLFAKGISDMADAIVQYSGKIGDITTEKIAEIKEKTEGIAEFLTTLKDLTPETNVGMKKFLDGANDLGTFGQTLTVFADNLMLYCQKIADDDINLVVMRNVMGEIKELTGFAEDIGGLGSSKISLIYTFGNDIYSFATYLKKYAETVAKIDFDKMDDTIDFTTKIVDAFVGTDKLSFGDQVATITTDFLDKMITAFGGNSTKTKTETAADKFIDYFRDRFLWEGTITKISLAVQNMINKSVYDEELVSGLKTGGNSMVEELQEGIVEGFEGDEGLIAKFGSFLESLITSIATEGQSGTKKRYYDAGAALITALANGMVNDEKVSGFGDPPALQLKNGFKELLDSLIGLIVSEEMKGQFQRGGASLINSLLGGFKSVDLTKEAEEIGGNVSKGVGKGMTDNLNVVSDAVGKVVQTTKSGLTSDKDGFAMNSPSKLTALYGWYLDGGLSDGLIDGIPMVVSAVGSVVDETKEAFTKSADQGGFDIHSNSWLTTLFGRFLDGGLADGLIDGIPGVRDAIDKVKNAITDKMGLNDLMNLLHENGLGALENTFADYVAQFGADFNIEDSMGEFKDQYTSYMNDVSIAGMEEFMAPYTEGSYATDGTTVFMDDITSTIDGYSSTRYSQGAEGSYSYFDGMGDSAISAAESIAPTMSTAGDIIGDAVATPIETRLAETLSYAEWVAKKYPEGLTKELSTPVFDFSDLYENMQGGQLEAILNMFDALDETGRKNLIRAYGLGEQGGNADLANYLTWYWKNEPTRMENLESIKQATEGYQAYLDEQKALQEAQALQSQQNYEGVQQIAADMQTHTDEFNAKYMAAIEEIKMTVMSIEEELNGVHADIAELNNMDVYIDSSALVGATAEKYNEELGNMAKIGRRGVTR